MKRGQGMSVQTVVMIILGLIVLTIIVLVVRQQVTGGAKKYTNISQEAEIKGDKCASFLLNRGCSEQPCDREKGFVEVFSPAGEWADCKTPKHCCQKE